MDMEDNRTPINGKERKNIILFGGQKGGVGKSTDAINFATVLAVRGCDVLLVDTDPQGSSNIWHSKRRKSEYELPRVEFEVQSGTEIHINLKDKSKRYEYVIVDAAGADSSELRSAMLAADLAIFPVAYSMFDLETLVLIDKLISNSKIYNPGIKTFILNGRASNIPLKRKNEHEELKSLLDETDHLRTLLKSTIIERQQYKDSVTLGMSVLEFLSRDGSVISKHTDYKKLIKNRSKKTISKYSPVGEMINLTDEILEYLN